LPHSAVVIFSQLWQYRGEHPAPGLQDLNFGAVVPGWQGRNMSVLCEGLEVVDLYGDPDFAARNLRSRHLSTPIDGVSRIARSFVEAPDTVLQELVQSAIDLCGADSAGISLEVPGSTDAQHHEWIATAGQYASLRNSVFPRVPSACGICLERGRPQRFRVAQHLFDSLHIPAAAVTDGFLLPLRIKGRMGVLFIVAHGRREAFDGDDLCIMRMLADMVLMGFSQQEKAGILAFPSHASVIESSTALAKKFDKSLQGMRAALHVAEWSGTTGEASRITGEMARLLEKLSGLVRQLLQAAAAPLRPN
jgi:hypothetical protein